MIDFCDLFLAKPTPLCQKEQFWVRKTRAALQLFQVTEINVTPFSL